MARPVAPLGSKDDDDSWGKLASDLLGVNLDETPDLDFPEPEPPPALVEPEPVEPEPAVAMAADFSEPPSEPAAEEPLADADTDAADTDAADTDAADEAASEARDEYWDALESWDWEESASSSRPPERRDARAPGGDRGGRPDRPRREGSDRRERSDRGERRDRGDRPQRDRPPRSDAPRGDAPRSRPAEHRPPEAGSPPRSRPAEPRPAPVKRPADDDFAAGLLDEGQAVAEDTWKPQAPQPTSFEGAKGPPPADEFDSELYEARPPSAARTEGPAEEGDEPQRRRRRRRRRGRRPDEASSPAEGGTARLPEDEEELEGVETTDEAEEGPVGERTPLTDEDRDRPRRRRRRRRRPGDRGDEPRAREPAVDRDEEPFADEDRPEAEEREPVVRTRYEDVPTWEEAISYLVRTRGEPPRGRGDDRDRRGGRPHRRPPSDDRSRHDA